MKVIHDHMARKSASVLAGSVAVFLLSLDVAANSPADESAAASRYHAHIEPILETYCYGCHGYGSHEGGHAFDEYSSDKALIGDVKLWLAVLKNARSGVMPPPSEDRPTNQERQTLFNWIERDVFKTDPADPDPGRVTLRRLNRVEYRNTVRDLTGVDYDTSSEFPPDDSGYGFDNIGDAMSVSPLLLEKYLTAARAIVAKAVPNAPPKDDNKDENKLYRRYFVRGAALNDSAKREAYAREILSSFLRRAYRRPADDHTVDRLVKLAKATYSTPGQSFETGVGTAMIAVLASPRFLFRVEESTAGAGDGPHPFIDEFALATRLSYFLWSTMPDDELLQAAERGELRKNLSFQVDRMLKDSRSYALAENFAGQWLRAAT